ncbi:cache domain-containing sensor histidine kinase [Cohnella cholangitidis]|uniref:histidine kinase n=1 Tax=Cohnella cholangitidis TaxID=2598458 RepID=A0A7G5C4M0_9BACL|nr:sensor histidine kinase [Cohnella cholangitidis]QMV44154.1 two-component sensor histidine kinase [Cohnella cholangitidis]
MMTIYHKIKPKSLKSKLFLSLLILIITPLIVLYLYLFNQFEGALQDKIVTQSSKGLDQVQQSTEDLMSLVYKTLVMVQNDKVIYDVLTEPEKYTELDRVHLIERVLKNIDNSIFLFNSQIVYYTLLDEYGSVYTSFQPQQMLDYNAIKNEHWAKQLNVDRPYLWIANDPNYVVRDVTSSKYLLTLGSTMRNTDNTPFSLARISIDYEKWFKASVHSDEEHQYYLIDKAGTLVSSFNSGLVLDSQVLHFFRETTEKGGFYFDQRTDSLVNYRSIPQLDWYFVDVIPRKVLFQEIWDLKVKFFSIFIAFIVLFIGINMFISYKFTKPLTVLEKKMSSIVKQNLKVTISEKNYTGEILQFIRSFNQMTTDMNTMVKLLKDEQKQKELVHFQMLLSQINPHFLLNTLNTIKWLAIRKGDKDIPDICLSLGNILETSLHSEVELIYLKDELKLIEDYLLIHELRYNDQLNVDYDFNSGMDYALVPKLSIQPLVENSILHGIAPLKGQGNIIIRIFTENKLLYIEIEDNGVGIQEQNKAQKGRSRKGIGLQNLKDRLQILFKEDGKLEVIPLEHGTLVRMQLPYLLSSPYEGG